MVMKLPSQLLDYKSNNVVNNMLSHFVAKAIATVLVSNIID